MSIGLGATLAGVAVCFSMIYSVVAWSPAAPKGRPRKSSKSQSAPPPAPIRLPNQKIPYFGALDIEYTDAEGDVSERYLEARSVEVRKGLVYLWAYCEQRQAIRCFRADRISALTDGETGEVADPANIAGWLLEQATVAQAA